MDINTLYRQLRFAHRQMIAAAGTAAHGTWRMIVREQEDKIKTLITLARISA